MHQHTDGSTRPARPCPHREACLRTPFSDKSVRQNHSPILESCRFSRRIQQSILACILISSNLVLFDRKHAIAVSWKSYLGAKTAYEADKGKLHVLIRHAIDASIDRTQVLQKTEKVKWYYGYIQVGDRFWEVTKKVSIKSASITHKFSQGTWRIKYDADHGLKDCTDADLGPTKVNSGSLSWKSRHPLLWLMDINLEQQKDSVRLSKSGDRFSHDTRFSKFHSTWTGQQKHKASD